MAGKSLSVGATVKDFTLKDQNGQDFTLSAFKGKKVLLSFHPLAWTSVCAKQMQALEKNVTVFGKMGAVAVGISVDSVPCKTAWAKSLKVKKTRLLADFWPHGKIAASVGLFRKEGFSERANILVDEKGKVAWIKVYPIRELPDIREVLATIKK
ncbi:MAG TPA: redoxin domain-containing protein [Syntrophales bacterium]|nr:redoxin domain-containing protein [Syntrophales bacterium]